MIDMQCVLSFIIYLSAHDISPFTTQSEKDFKVDAAKSCKFICGYFINHAVSTVM